MTTKTSTVRIFALVALLTALLSACGVVATFVPPIEVGDVLGVDGQTLTTTFAAPEGALTTQVKSVSTDTFEQTFDDQDLDLYGFSLRDFVAVIGFGPEVELTAPLGASHPESFTLVAASIEATLSDAVHGSATMSLARELELRFERDAGCVAVSCVYRFVGDADALAEALTLVASEEPDARETLRRFVDIVVLDGENSPNRGLVTVGVEVDSAVSLAGFEARFELRNASTTIRLGG